MLEMRQQKDKQMIGGYFVRYVNVKTLTSSFSWHFFSVVFAWCSKRSGWVGKCVGEQFLNRWCILSDFTSVAQVRCL